MKQNSLSRDQRLKSRKQINRIFGEGKYMNMPPIRVGYILDELVNGDQLQIGVGVSSRFFKKAVDRNRVKRILRESWRLQKAPLAELAQQKGRSLKVFIIYTGRELPEYRQVYTKVGAAIAQFKSILDEKDPANT